MEYVEGWGIFGVRATVNAYPVSTVFDQTRFAQDEGLCRRSGLADCKILLFEELWVLLAGAVIEAKSPLKLRSDMVSV